MTQTTNRIFDELAKLMTDAAGAAQGFKTEIDQAIRSQAERVLNELEVVQREEFEAAKTMAQKAREQNDELLKKIDKLEQRIMELEADQQIAHATPRPVRK